MMSGCENAAPLLSEYVDGRLPAEQREQVDRHLGTCSACREDLESLRATVQLLCAMPVMRVPRPFTLAAPAPRPSVLFVYLRAATAAATVLFALFMGGSILVQEAMAPFAPPPAVLQYRATVGTAPSITGTPAPAPQPLTVTGTQQKTGADQAMRDPAAPATAPTTTGPPAPSLAYAPAGAPAATMSTPAPSVIAPALPLAAARAPTAPAAQAPAEEVGGERLPTRAATPAAAPTSTSPPPTAPPQLAAAPTATEPEREAASAPRPPKPPPTVAPEALRVTPGGPSAAEWLRWAQIAAAVATLILAAATFWVWRRPWKS